VPERKKIHVWVNLITAAVRSRTEENSCVDEFGNSSQQVPEKKKIHMYVNLVTAANDRSRTEENSCVDEFCNSKPTTGARTKENSCVGQEPAQNCISTEEKKARHTETGKIIAET
jgi:hypothetical protein